MLTPRDITEPGIYWYFDAIGAPAQIVEVGPPEARRGELLVSFIGREDSDAVQDLSGAFLGPIAPPSA